MAEIEGKRTKTSKTFDLGNGRYRLEAGNHSHVLKNGLWVPKDASIISEDGADSDTGLQYIAKSRVETLDYDIKFGKNDPVWMKIKHILTGKKVTFKPKNNKNKPAHTFVGNKISVSQAWDGIDMQIFVTDRGIKSNYIITSASGQRVVEFDVNGDIPSFYVEAPWYINPITRVRIPIPTAFNSGTLAYDFTSVPIGTVIDPTVSAEGALDYTHYRDSSSSWSTIRDNATSSGGYTTPAISWIVLVQKYGGSLYSLYRNLLSFDLSAIDDSASITSASFFNNAVNIYSDAGSPTMVVYSGTYTHDAIPWGSSNYSAFSTAISGTKTIAAGWNETVLTDFSFIDKTSTYSFGTRVVLREGHDVSNTPPSTATNTGFEGYSSNSGTPSLRPYISVEYTVGGSSGPSPHYTRRRLSGGIPLGGI